MWMQLLMAVLPAITRGMGAAMAAGDYAKAEALRKQAMEQLNIPLPDIKDLQAQMSPTALAGVQANQGYTDAQNEALSGLKGYATSTGLNDKDQGSLDAATMEASNAYSGMMGRNSQLRAARGQVGSGADTADQLASAQAGADRAYHGAIQTAASAADRRMQAMGAYGSMAERLRQADLNQKNLVANASDRIDEYNTHAKSYGAQQYFDNQYKLGQAKANAYQGAATQNIQAGQQKEQTGADIGTGLQQGYQAYDEGQRYDKYLNKKYGGGE